MPTHAVTIIETESITADRLVYRAHCTCHWSGWAVIDPDSARRQGERHIERAEIDRVVLSKGQADV